MGDMVTEENKIPKSIKENTVSIIKILFVILLAVIALAVSNEFLSKTYTKGSLSLRCDFNYRLMEESESSLLLGRDEPYEINISVAYNRVESTRDVGDTISDIIQMWTENSDEIIEAPKEIVINGEKWVRMVNRMSLGDNICYIMLKPRKEQTEIYVIMFGMPENTYEDNKREVEKIAKTFSLLETDIK